MYVYHHGGFGQAVAATVVGTAIANVVINAGHMLKVGALQKKFGGKLESDQQKMDYLKIILLRLQSLSTRLAKGGRYRPGTKGFEVLLGRAIKNDMKYKGYCNADIYFPFVAGAPPKVWASFTRAGHVSAGAVPRDAGALWAGRCKNAEDEARMAYIKRFKGRRKHSIFKAFKEDLGTMDLFLRFGLGAFLVAVMVMAIKVQRAVIKEQKPQLKKKKKKKKKEKPAS